MNYSWTIKLNPNQVKKIKCFLENEKVDQVKNNSSLYEVSMYE